MKLRAQQYSLFSCVSNSKKNSKIKPKEVLASSLSHMSGTGIHWRSIDDIFGETNIGDAALLERNRMLLEMFEHLGDGRKP